MSTLITKTETEALLGRPLTPVENKNYALYLDLAVTKLVSLLCLSEPPTEITDVRMKDLLAHLFGVKTAEAEYMKRNGISAKQVEDFRVTYDGEEKTPMEALVETYASEIAALSKCGAIRSGKVCRGNSFYPI